MAGLVPAIHAAPLRIIFGISVCGSAWIPGTRPGKTRLGRKAVLADGNRVFPLPAESCPRQS
jgi:hypothetical protein